GAVVVDLTPVVTTLIHGVHTPALQPFVPVLANLVARHRLTVTLMTAAQLTQARSLFAQIVNAEWSLDALAAALAVVALAAARHRWRVLFGGACCTVVATALGFVALAAARGASVSRAARSGADQLLSAKVFDVLDRYLRLDLTVTLIVAAVIALAVGTGAVVRRRRDGPGGQMGRSATEASKATMSSSPSTT
ncbi:MAG TPA: hypothetical protein VHW47_06955, partial [Acidimicrobiales bacterium]|nr:hypothetical protein [Acidimicrobiales bacterium]